MKYIYRVLVFSILFSCENKSISEKETSTVNSFPQTITLKGEEQKLEALGIVDIMVIDTFLIAYTPMNHDYYYLVYSTSNLKKLGKFLPEGRGANEFYALVHDKCHETEDGIIKTWLNNGFIKYCWNISQSVKEGHTVIDSVIMSKGILSSGTWYTTSNNNELVGFQYSSNNMYYISYNLTHHQEVHRHKIFSRNFPTQKLEIVAMNTCIKPDRSKIALVGWNNNYICIFNSDFSELRPFTIYGKGISINKAATMEPSARILYYSCENSTDRYLYALYVNQPEEKRQYHTGNEEIHIYNWDANPIANIIISENIMCFAVDEKYKCLYGLTSDEKLYKYDLSKYFDKL